MDWGKEMRFFTPFGVIIVGGVSIQAYVQTTLAGDLCFMARRLAIGPSLTFVIALQVFMAGEIPRIMRAGLEFGFDLLNLKVHAPIGLGMKAGPRIGLKCDITIQNPIVTALVFFETFFLKFCNFIPCGFDWKRWIEQELFSFPIFPGKPSSYTHPLFEVSSPARDKTAPTQGSIRAVQLNTDTIEISTGGWLDEDTEIHGFKVFVVNMANSERIFEQDFPDDPEEYTNEAMAGIGTLQLKACAEVENEVGLKTEGCTDPFTWDGDPPELTGMRLRNPVNGKFSDFTPRECGYLPSASDFTFDKCKTPFFHSNPLQFDFEVDLKDEDSGGLSMLLWSLETSLLDLPNLARARVLDGEIATAKDALPGETVTLTWVPDEVKWPYPSGPTGILEELQGATLYLHIYACDAMYNCKTNHGYPIVIDLKTPEPPSFFLAEHQFNTSADYETHYLVNPRRVAPGWNTIGVDWRDLRDGTTSLLKKYKAMPFPIDQPFAMSGLPFARTVFASISDQKYLVQTWFSMCVYLVDENRVEGSSPLKITDTVNAAEAPFQWMSVQGVGDRHPHSSPNLAPVAFARPRDTKLYHNAMYRVELTQFGLNGLESVTLSDPFRADFTAAVCKDAPLAVFTEGARFLRAGEYPDGARRWFGIRQFNWISPDIRLLGIDISEETCKDPESGIHAAVYAIGTYPRGDDIVPWQVTRALTPQQVEVPDDLPFGVDPDGICDWCSSAHYVSVGCMNGAAQTEYCEVPPSFRIDGTPPQCLEGIPMLGYGRDYAYQPDTSLLMVHNFVGALQDDETGILEVRYALVDLTDESCQTMHGCAKTPLPTLAHTGLPRNLLGEYAPKHYVQNLELLHGHTYVVEAVATNTVGMEGDPCVTTPTTIDVTPPNVGNVFVVTSDDAMFDEFPEPGSYQYSTQVLRVAARNFTEDVSPIFGSYVSVMRLDQNYIVADVWVGPRDFVTLDVSLAHDESFKAIWRTENAAGLSSESESNWITVDGTRPVISYARDAARLLDANRLLDDDDVSCAPAPQ